MSVTNSPARMAGIWLALLLLVGLRAVSAASPQAMAALNATGQDTTEQSIVAPVGLPAAEVERFVAPLSDNQARVLLIGALKAQAPAPAQRHAMSSSFADYLDRLRATIDRFATRTQAVSAAYHNLPDTLERMLLLLTDLEGLDAFWPGLLALAAMIVCGAVAAALTHRLCRQPRRSIAQASPQSALAKVIYLGARLALDALDVAVFMAAGLALSFVLFASVNPMRLFTVTYLSVAAATFLAWALARNMFAPQMPDKRVIPMSDTAARRNTWVLVALTALTATGFFSGGFLELIGADRDTLALLRLVIVALFGVILIGHLLSAPPPNTVEPMWLQQWRWLATVYVLVVTAIWATNVVLDHEQAAQAAFASIFLVLAVPAFDRALRHQQTPAVTAASVDDATIFPLEAANVEGAPSAVGAEDTPAAAGASALAVRSARIAVSVLLLSGALVTLIEASTGAVTPWLATATGMRVSSGLLEALLTVIIACVAWSLVGGLIDAAVERERLKAEAAAAEEGEADSEGGSMVVGTRALTLLPLARGTALVVIIGVATMMVLSAVGIDIGPLLAGAGVVGLAIGFGAQALVRDVVSGVFFLIDDAFRIGEYIEMGDMRGEVEKISIRSMQLRHHRGPIQTVPFGEIKSITNYNRDWVIYKQEFRVPYDTDLERVRKLIKKLGQSMLEHPEYGQHFIEPLKSQGVRRIEDSALIIGTKFMCKPRKQFVLRRHVFQNIQTMFQENGIEFARRRVIVESGGSGVQGAAAAEAAEAALVQEQAASTGSGP